MENLIFRHGCIFLATSFSWHEDALLLNFSAESEENWEKQQKVATPLLFDHSEQVSLVLYPETKYQTWNYKA